MIKKFFRKANSLFLAAAMTVTMIPAQMISAAGPTDTPDSGIMQQTEGASDSDVNITVIEGNTPIFPSKMNASRDNGMVNVTWADWEDASGDDGTYKVNGTTDDGRQVEATVNVLPCDEVVADVRATGREDDTDEEKLKAVHPLKGYKGLFVTEYDIVVDDPVTFTDRGVIYLPEAARPDQNSGVLQADNAWDYGARMQFQKEINGERYFQACDGDGNGNKTDLPSIDTIKEQIAQNGKASVPKVEAGKTYRVRTVMDTTTDTTKGNFKLYITDSDGVQYEITGPNGYGFRVYPTDGIIKNFAAVRGGYDMKNHKVSWIAGYATKNVETYLKAQGATDYAKDGETVVTKEIPERIAEEPEAEIIKDNKKYVLNTEKSGWYNGETKVASVTADAGDTVTYRAYYDFSAVIDKTSLDKKIQEAEGLKENEADYTATSWKALQNALTTANGVYEDASAGQEAVTGAVETLTTAIDNLVSIKSLREAIDDFEKGLPEETQKDNYTNWDDVQKALVDAKNVLAKKNATKEDVETAEKDLKDAKLITRTEAAKKEMDDAVETAKNTLKDLKEADYTPASWQAIQNALKACEDLNSDTATKDDYDAKKAALNEAMGKLAKLADKTALNQAIAEAEGKKEADYEVASYKEMQQKLAAAKTVAGNANATQAEVDKAKTDLQDAVKNLKSKTTQQPQPTEVKVNSIKPAAKTYKIAINKKLDLKKVFTALPENATNKNMTYSIDKKYGKYASINKSGVVTVKKAGAGKTVVVKATSADGSNKTATVKIKIMKNAVTKITVKKKSLSVKAGKKVTIKPVIKTNGKKVNKTVEYTSSDEKLATVNKKGVVTTKKGKTGKVTITIKSTDGTNKSAKVKITIKK